MDCGQQQPMAKLANHVLQQRPRGVQGGRVERWAAEFEEEKVEGPHHSGSRQWANEFQRWRPAQPQPHHTEWVDDFTRMQIQQRPSQPSQGSIDSQALNELINSDNPKFRNSKFVHFLTGLQSGRIELDTANNTIREHAQPSQAAPMAWGDAFEPQNQETWAQEFASHPEDWAREWNEQENVDRWANEFDQFDWDAVANMGSQRSHIGRGEYVFAPQNPFLGQENMLEKGKELFSRGHLTDAILAFEAHVQDHAADDQAWCLLGKANQFNENETQAIRAQENAVQSQPNNLEALMTLGISYTNDLEQGQALRYLRAWLERNPKYSYLADTSTDPVISTFENVLMQFTRAVNEHPDDANLHSILGVLYNISNEYEKAIECFVNATKLRPNDATLWNKLGATQANGSRSADAIQSYKRALQLRPNYVRSLTNLGISFANQGMHREAASAYLASLDKNANADHVWNYLRIALVSMERPDLAELCATKQTQVFRGLFEF